MKCKYTEQMDSKQTNFERIKAMSVEELKTFLYCISKAACVYDCDCDKCPLENAGHCTEDGIKKWLESEVDE